MMEIVSKILEKVSMGDLGQQGVNEEGLGTPLQSQFLFLELSKMTPLTT